MLPRADSQLLHQKYAPPFHDMASHGIVVSCRVVSRVRWSSDTTKPRTENALAHRSVLPPFYGRDLPVYGNWHSGGQCWPCRFALSLSVFSKNKLCLPPIFPLFPNGSPLSPCILVFLSSLDLCHSFFSSRFCFHSCQLVAVWR